MAISNSDYIESSAKGPWIDNYIYLYHIDKFLFMPEFSDSVTDELQIEYSPSTVLSRTAPIYSYSNSGPRTISLTFNLHRDMMMELNHGVSNADLDIGEDYVDVLVRYIQAAALPAYDTSAKLVNPPIVAVRLGDDIFIKGVVQGGVGVTYKYPIIPGIDAQGNKDENKHRYSNVDLAFTIAEIDPYDADSVASYGSFRGITPGLNAKAETAFSNLSLSLERNMYTYKSSN